MGVASATPSSDIDDFLRRCVFPTPGTHVDCAFSGGADSSALLVLAVAAGLDVTAHHVNHHLRSASTGEAEHAERIAASIGVAFVLHHVEPGAGPNLEARARTARQQVLPTGALTGHTADDQAETLLIRLLRGAGSTGLSAIEPGPTHPLLALRRADTEAICAHHGITPVTDPTNTDPAFWRNRVRNELIPLLNDIAGRDPVPVLRRTADLLRDDDQFLDRLAEALDPTDARAVANADPVIARRALRRWLTVDGYPPDLAAIERVLAVANGDTLACEIAGGRRIARKDQRLRVEHE